VKKVITIGILALAVLAVSCDRQKALNRIVEDPQMKSYILGEMLKNGDTKAQLADSIFADKAITDMYLEKLISDENARADLLDRIIRNDTSGAWIIGKLAQDSTLASKMRQLPKK
jgi:hypothetical protein